MSYATVLDIQNNYQGITFGASDYVNSTKVEAMIAEADAYIDLVLGKRYTVPITNTTDLIIVKHICVGLVTHRIDGVFRESKSEDRKFDYARNTKKEAMDILDKIVKGEVTLSTTRKTSAIKFNNVDSNSDTVTPYFKQRESNPDNWS